MLKCPRYNSKELYKFGKDRRTGKQKYQFIKCKRQFRIGDGYGKEQIKHPRLPKCPKCGKGLDIYKWQKHFKRLRCKSCNYKFNSIIDSLYNYM